MWKKMTEGWLWVVALIDAALAFGIAQLFVQFFGWRWSYMMDAPLDASASILCYTGMLGVALPILTLFGGAIVATEAPKLFARR